MPLLNIPNPGSWNLSMRSAFLCATISSNIVFSAATVMDHTVGMASYVADKSTSNGEYDRDTHYITTRITADARDGYPVEPDRYRLIVARACPWANRAIIVRRLLGLEDVLSIGFCGPTHDERSWTFDLDPGGLDPVLKIPRLRDAYLKRVPDYPKGITVPAI